MFLMASMTLACIASIQFPIKLVAADGLPSPSAGKSYTWNVEATNGPVSWYNFSYPNDFEGQHTLVVGGTIQYNLTGQYPDDGYSFPGNVWYGNFSIFHNSSLTQIWNWTRVNCSTTEVGSNLALSAYGWLGGLIAPTNWTENFNDINGQPSDHTATLLVSNTAIIDYTYLGQITHLEYNTTTGLLLYARTSFTGYNLEISLSGISPAKSVARIGYNASALKINESVQFWDESYNGSHPYTYQWSFGDGSTNSTGINPTHVYSTPGTYNVTLTISDKIARKNKTTTSIVISGLAPSAPQDLQATPGNGQVMLTWQAPASDGGVSITNYKIYRGTSATGLVYIATVSSGLTFTDASATNGQIYYYKVSAVNAIGEGALSAVASATPSALIPGYQLGIIVGIIAILSAAIPILSKKKFHK